MLDRSSPQCRNPAGRRDTIIGDTGAVGDFVMSTVPVRAVLWDADGVLQHTPADSWELAVQVVDRFPGALTGTPIDEQRIRAVAHELGSGDRADDIVAVWSTFDLLTPILGVVGRVRAAGTPCYLATNQDAYRAACMRAAAPYGELLDGAYYSCDIGAAKPSAAFFEHIVTDLGLAPNELLFLDDQPGNVAGARAAGLAADCWTHDDGIAKLHDILEAHSISLDGGGATAHPE
jgi:putative hydrolase of the HAD superfamily